MPPQRRAVMAYFTKDATYVVCQQTTDRGDVAVEPMVKLPGQLDASSLGAAILEGLAAHREVHGVAEPQTGALLALSGKKTWAAFAKNTIGVTVEQMGDKLFLYAARANTRGAFNFAPPTECAGDAESLGKALQAQVDAL